MSEQKKGNEGEKVEKEVGRFKRFIRFLFPKKTEHENILQYLIRQLFIPDASGKPSITVTILFYVMLVVGIVTFVETKNAQVITKQTQDNITISQPTGYSENFLYLIIGLSVVITSFYRGRQNKVGSSEEGEKTLGLIDAAKEYISNVVKKV